MANDKFGAKEVMDVVLLDLASGKPVIYFDTLKTSDIAVTSEKVYARGGKGNPKLITWEINKDATLNITDALISPKSMELISGLKSKIGVQTLYMRQSTEWDLTDPSNPYDKGALFPLKANATGEIDLAFEPKDAVADIYVYDSNDDFGTPMDMTGATLVGKKLTVDDAADKQVVVYYNFDTNAEADTYIIDSSHFSGSYKLVGFTVIRNRDTGKDEQFQVQIPNLKWSSNLTLSFAAEGDPSPIEFACEILRDAKTPTMIQMTRWNG